MHDRGSQFAGRGEAWVEEARVEAGSQVHRVTVGIQKEKEMVSQICSSHRQRLEKLIVSAALLPMNLLGPACEALDAASGRRPVGKRTGTAGSLELGELFLVENHVESGNRERERERKPNEREDRDSMVENRDDDSDDDDDSR